MSRRPRLGDYFANRQESGRDGLPTMSVTMNDGLVHRDELERRTETTLRPDQHLLVRRGDIAYNMMRMWQGACGLADADGLVSPAYVVLASKDGIDSRFAYHWFKSDRMTYLFWAYSHGLTEDRLRLYFDDFAEIPIAPPPLDQQRRIGAVLDTWDRTIDRTEQLIAAKRRRRGLAVRAALHSVNYTVTLPDVAGIIMGQSPPSLAYNERGEGLPLVQGAGDFGKWTVEPSVWTRTAPKRASRGSLLMTVRAPVGELMRTDRDVCLGRGVCAINAEADEDQDFLGAVLESITVSWRRLQQGSSFSAVGAGEIAELPIPWPNAKERAFIGRLDSALRRDERATTIVRDRLRIQKRGLMQKLLTGKWRLGGRFDPAASDCQPVLAEGSA